MPWEKEEAALRREVYEETGLRILQHRFLLRYDSSLELPVSLAVFEADVEGEIRDSWEGTPCWMEAGDALPRILRSQRRIVDTLLNPQGSGAS